MDAKGKLRGEVVRRAQGLLSRFRRPRKDTDATGTPQVAPETEPSPDSAPEPEAATAPAPESIETPYEKESVCVPREDETSLNLLVLRPKGGHYASLPGILWLHGGGFASGMNETLLNGMPVRLMGEQPCVVVCPEYRLARDMPWPGGLDDAHAGLVWLRDNAADLGVSDERLMVGGESAGGGMAVALCLFERDLRRVGQDGVAICFHMPLYPMLDDRPTVSSQNNRAPVWDSNLSREAWDLYLAGLDRADVSPYAAPARATSYEGMPAGVTFVGTLEPFLDETVTYVRRMRSDGVDMDFRLYRDCHHAFDLFGDGVDAQAARAFVLRKFGSACEERRATQ